MIQLLIATDAWRPQVNGVVRSIEQMAAELPRLGTEATVLSPDAFRTIAMPTYPEVRLAVGWPATFARAIEAARPGMIHIATEGPIGYAVRRWCLRHRFPFSTSYHTRFPEYAAKRWPIPLGVTYALLRRFHNAGQGCMVATATLEKELSRRGFRNLMYWSRGVDAALFRPRPEEPPSDLPGPVFLYVGRVAVEKNLRAFLDLDLPGSKVVIGDGPDLAGLRDAYPAVHFRGVLTGEALARAYAAASVFVFPSRTDTFGMVLLEALASGLPVAAYPVPGPADVIGTASVGVLDEDLRAAALAALRIPRDRCRAFALEYGWEASARQFLANCTAAHHRPAAKPGRA